MIVLKFGVRKILSGIDAARAEMHGAHHLYNALVAVERWRRQEYAAIRSHYVPGLSEVEEAYEQISEWIGEHAGKEGERGEIRAKRQKVTRARKQPKHRLPNPSAERAAWDLAATKQVDDSAEIDAIAEMKVWRSAASAMAKPLRAQFDGMINAPRLEYEIRTRGVPREWIERRESLRNDIETLDDEVLEAATKKVLAKLDEEIEAGSRKTHKKAAANVRVLAEMLDEPWHEAWKDIARHDAVAHTLRQWVGGAHNLNHGTYVAVDEDVERAGKRPKPRPDGEPRKPRRRPAFSSKGFRKIGWQLQGTWTWGDIVAGKCRDVIVSNVQPVGGHAQRGERELRWRATVKIRITTAERGVVQWVECEIAQHRPVPDDTRISWVYFVPEERPGGSWDYSVQFTASPTEPLIRRAVGEGPVHVEFCWTQAGSTLVVARINGVPLELPRGRPGNPAARGRGARQPNPGIVERLRSAERFRGYTDKHFDEARAEVVARLNALPPDVQAACAGIHQWRGHYKLARVAQMLVAPLPDGLVEDTWRDWRSTRLRAGLDLHASFAVFTTWAGAGVPAARFALWLEFWRRKDHHLEKMAGGTRDAATRRRKDFYRVTAARLAERYATCSLGGAVDLAAIALRDKAEDVPAELHQAARHNRQLAAVSELKEAIKYAFGKDRMIKSPEQPEPARERSGDDADSGGARSSVNDAESVESAASYEAAE